MIIRYIKTQGELRVLDFLLKNKSNIYNMQQIMNGSKIHYETAKYSIKSLLKKRLIKKAMKCHKSYLFKLNIDNDFIQSLLFHFENIKIYKKI